MKSPSPGPKSTLFLWFLIPLPIGGALIVFLYPKILTGDFAEISIESITSTAPGEVEIRYRGRISVGTGLQEGVRRSGVESNYSLGSFAGGFAGRPKVIGESTLVTYSIHNERGVPGKPDEVRARILVEVGRTYKIRPGRGLWIYRYTASDGSETARSFEVVPIGR